MNTMTVKGAWKGWDGKTFVEMTDGSKWKQAEYYYEYHYAYSPQATVTNDGLMLVDGRAELCGCAAYTGVTEPDDGLCRPRNLSVAFEIRQHLAGRKANDLGLCSED
jgi:hypothetical protein